MSFLNNFHHTTSKHGTYYYIYHYVCNDVGHILLHDYVVNSNLWLMPLVIILVIVIFTINHVTFITTTTFIITMENIIK
jgi:hypothetical protein